MEKELVFGQNDRRLGRIDNSLRTFLERSFELRVVRGCPQAGRRSSELTSGITSPGSVVSLWASSSLKDIRCAISTSQ